MSPVDRFVNFILPETASESCRTNDEGGASKCYVDSDLVTLVCINYLAR